MKWKLSAEEHMSSGVQLHTVDVTQTFTVVDKNLEALPQPYDMNCTCYHTVSFTSTITRFANMGFTQSSHKQPLYSN